MRFVIFGAGAIGGVVGGKLHQAGHDVALIARGAHYEAIRDRGLTIEQPHQTAAIQIPVADSPGALEWTGEDVVMVATKSQDTAGALEALRGSAPASIPVVCLQNGVENERLALRLFANVYGAVVMSPTAHLEPGIVQAYGTRGTGVIDVGRYPSGLDALSEEITTALGASDFSSMARPDIMRFKYAKLLSNLGNAVDAICEPGPDADELNQVAREEGTAVLGAAGIEFVAPEVNDVEARWARLELKPIAGRERAGSSTRQSVARGTPTVETDYLNGEVSLLGRLHRVATPINDALCALSARHVRERLAPQTVHAREVLALARSADYADGPVRR
ncbi:MAG TPA: 2-dehydropantoate 2-reductase [Solirubrobacteraceae bacterium]|nr:2-dehydropantoate 2-reductase [Solirubrobacteraceae bacterium]